MLNNALQQWRNNETSLGVWSNLPDIHIAETLARMSPDWICFDLQHGLMDYSDLTRLLPAISGLAVTPLVRVAANQSDQIGKVLDVGAQGVIVPMVNTADEAKQAVAACRYPPLGSRSCGPMRGVMMEGFSYLESANDQIACVVMIETEEGLKNVDEIAAVEGVDGLFIGPVDLCYGIGLPPGRFEDPKFTKAVSTILRACKSHNRAAGMYGYTADMAFDSLQQGFNFVSVGTDIAFLRAGAEQAMAAARGDNGADGSSPGGY